MWLPLIPLLAERFTVIALDLPGIGDSEIPSSGLDMKTAAVRMHALVLSLGIHKAEVSGARHRADGGVCFMPRSFRRRWTRAHLLRILLERSGSRQKPVHPRRGSKSLHSSLFGTRAHAGWMGLLRLIHPGCQRFRATRKDQLSMPVLSSGEESLGDALGRQMKLVGTDVTVIVLKDTGHWIMEERLKETMDALVKFL